MKYGIKETEEFFDFILDGLEAYMKSAEDGKFNWLDTTNFIAPLRSSFAGISGIDQLPLEFSDLDDSEKLILRNKVEVRLKLKSEKAEEVAKIIFAWVLDSFQAAFTVRDILKAEA